MKDFIFVSKANSTLNLCVNDQDLFFRNGMILITVDWFNEKCDDFFIKYNGIHIYMIFESDTPGRKYNEDVMDIQTADDKIVLRFTLINSIFINIKKNLDDNFFLRNSCIEDFRGELDKRIEQICNCVKPSRVKKTVLTRMEVNVLSHIQQGLNNNDIACIFCCSPRTISLHKRNAMSKLGFKKNNELYQWLLSSGLDRYVN
ncbi:helix-turn-helix transcriptional regulator [Citrobacter portucalensis]|uniref:Helix-turn-helix transcriptional regulator n=1 Tax=Citrobacter portucalensis TaxID=1639133 RepID=A0AAW5W8A4_9ENTR|nr:helix-turn-helix transcriptional regulator [Citrobacter portucalensis]MCX9004731.1 helix-turn-helix transcriptional regulator [Citrobacter portucalensis]